MDSRSKSEAEAPSPDKANCPLSWPVSTYRVQINKNYSLRKAAALVEYLSDLGITDFYASPVFRARSGSLHGYDIVDYAVINPEVGGKSALGRLAEKLRARKMGLLMDIVPNHMCIADPDNRWWWDVLENGPSSHFAKYFDIDWNPPRANLKNKVLLPVLEASVEEVVHQGGLCLEFDMSTFWLRCGGTRYPLEAKSWSVILRKAVRKMGASTPDARDMLPLERIASVLDSLPDYADAEPASIETRRRQIPQIKKKLFRMLRNREACRRAVESVMEEENATAADPGNDNILKRILSLQPYRLAYWRDGARKLNYRRFFVINDLCGIRVEDSAVFSATHALVFRMIEQGWVTGLRVDHIDGLLDPEIYLSVLSRACSSARRIRVGKSSKRPFGDFYIIVEKILSGDEELEKSWPVSGTTGYEFLHLLNGLFVDPSGRDAFFRLYVRFTGMKKCFRDLVYESKKKILRELMASEWKQLAGLLKKAASVSEERRQFRPSEYADALIEIISRFPVYRTYIPEKTLTPSRKDRKLIELAFQRLDEEGPGRKNRAVRFIKSMLLGPRDGFKAGKRGEISETRRRFVTRFQQLTGPVMAKGFEDTALYRFFPLASLNEVGGEPDRFGVSPAVFHQNNRRRLKKWPFALSATSTHDTKRSEDVRARLNVLSEMPVEWEGAVRRWQAMNRIHRFRLGRSLAPDSNDEYLIYQTLIGVWPCRPRGNLLPKGFMKRIQEYMRKAIREAKVHTKWIDPEPAYEEGVDRFIQRILDRERSGTFRDNLEGFLSRVVNPGIYNSLSQTLLKITSPGVPDIYQGCESLNFSLVDPDNRRPIEFDRLRRSLSRLNFLARDDLSGLSKRLLRRPYDGRAKLFVTTRALQYRREHPALFAEGQYVPIHARGGKRNHIVGFARVSRSDAAVVLAGRFFLKLGADKRIPIGRDVWGDTAFGLPKKIPSGIYRDVLTGLTWKVRRKAGVFHIPTSSIFSHYPVALLGRIS